MKHHFHPFAKRKALLCLFVFVLAFPFICSPSGSSSGTLPSLSSSLVAYGASEDQTLRGVWVSSVKNLDYPSTPTTDTARLEKELEDIVKNTKEMGLNAIFFQVRPTADSLYDSDIFPWSRYLTGTPGQAPANGFDPLETLIQLAHQEGIQVHAWLNPYRITRDGQTDYQSLPQNHPARLHPEYTVQYTDQNYYFDPGLPQVQDLVVEGALEIVKNYDVDGIHLDDYFYPGTDFDDKDTFAAYGSGFSQIDDWRRNNVNTLVQRLDQELHQAKPGISFGISPSGIWANKSSLSQGSDTNGKESYFQAYADTRLWAKEGWVDYIAPQIYWNIGYEIADYQVLSDWWSQTCRGTDTDLYIGIAAYKCGNADPASPWHGASELTRQLSLNASNDQIAGEIFFRYRSLLDIDGAQEALKAFYLGEGSGGQEENGENQEQTPENPSQESITFTDLDQAPWARDYIYRLAGEGIVSGKGNGLFDPMATLTRAEYVTMLVKTFGIPQEEGQLSTYSDVSPSHWSSGILAAAQQAGILPQPQSQGSTPSGLTGPGSFSPDQPITREDMALFAYNGLVYAGLSTQGEKDTSFTDQHLVSDPARLTAVNALASLGILNGYPEDQSFRPQGNATRAEASTMICALLDHVRAG